MPRLLKASVFFCLLCSSVLAQNQPPTVRVLAPTGVQEGGYSNITLIASDPEGDSISFNWTIADDPTGKAGYFVNPDLLTNVTGQASVKAAVAEGPSFPNASFTGLTIVYHVDVSDGTNMVPFDIPLNVTGVNHYPILSFDTEKLGTQSDPRLAGEGLSIDASGSRDPDGVPVHMLFFIKEVSGGTVCPNSGGIVLLGKETYHPGFSVPKVSSLPSSPMRIIIAVVVEDGLFVHQQNFNAYIASPTGCSGGTQPASLTANPSASPSSPLVGQSVTLRANASGGRTPYSYSWTQLSNSTGVNIVNSFSATAQFTAPSTAQVLQILLQVQDADQRLVTKSLSVSVRPDGSTGGDGGSGDTGQGTGTSTGVTECSDGGNSPATGTVPATFTIEGGNQASISVTNARDPDNTTVFVNGITVSGVTYHWSLADGGGFLSGGNLSATETRTVMVNTPNVAVQSTAVLSVQVRDAAACGTRYNVNLVVTPSQQQPNNNPPVANLKFKVNNGAQISAPSQQTLVGPAEVLFDASASSDSDGTITVGYSLQQNLTAGGATLTNLANSQSRLEINSGSVGTVSVTLVVTDDDNATDSVVQQFTLEEPDVIPVAAATVMVDGREIGPGESAAEGSVVTLDGSDSSLPEGDSSNLTFQWRQTAGPLVNLSGSDQAMASFRAPQADSSNVPLRFELTVFNGSTPSDPVVLEVHIAIPALYFSQVAFGPFVDEMFQTVLVLVNSQDEDADDVTIEFYDQQGEPLAVSLDGEPWDPETPFHLGSTISRRFEFQAQDEDTTIIGWARIRADVRLTGLVLYQLVDRETRALDAEVSLFATQRGSRFTTFFGVDDGLAAAIANPGENEARLIVKLIDEDFGPDLPLVTKPIILPPGQQLATFLDENYFGFLPPGFTQGTLVVETVQGRIAMTVLKTQGGVAISTLPLARR